MDHLATIWGTINPPPGVTAYGGNNLGGLGLFMSVIVKSIIAFAGVYAFINLILAGFSFMSAGGNSEKIAQSWSKIYMTMIGLLVAVASFVIAGILGRLLFNDWSALTRLRYFTP
jgi:hypothetical protein